MSTAIVWFRHDLRLQDHGPLQEAVDQHQQVIPLYILEEDDANPWPMGGAQRWWLHHSLSALQHELSKLGSGLILRRGKCEAVLQKLINETQAEVVFWHRHYEPYTIERDQKIVRALEQHDIQWKSFRGYLLTEPTKITNKQGGPFKVFTPFWKHCRQHLNPARSIAPPEKLPKLPKLPSDSLTDWALLPEKNWADHFSTLWKPGEEGAHDKLTEFLHDGLSRYHGGRDFPAQANTSCMSPHIHFGEISPRQIWHTVQDIASTHSINQKCIDTFLSQLGWREFSYHLLTHFPSLPEKNFKEQFDAFPWHENKKYLTAWQRGQTGYPIVDAGMRELWQTGTMHNRVRMITASFLIKDLLIDWREGERWFWDTLCDADLANNAASWQWVAGSGADAAPYFRIFNPTLQGQKFDPEGDYILRWVPELKDVPAKYRHCPWESPNPIEHYPTPIVDHSEARKQALAYYQKIK